MNVIIGANSNLNKGSSGLITGEIYFEDNNNFFPEKGWNDFPAIILGWWINSYLNFIRENLKTFEFCFMDGPFKVIGLLTQEEMIEIYFWSQYGDVSEKMCLGYISKKEMQNVLLRACRNLFRAMALSGISNDNLDGLRKMFSELKNL